MNYNIICRYSVLALPVLMCGLTALAQTDQPLTKEVEVVRAYQPTITDAIKILPTPKIVDTTSYIPSFNYQIKSTGISTERTINSLPSVPLGSAPKQETNTGFLKLAAGNAYSPYAEFFLNTTPSKKSEFGMHLFHFSSRPSIRLNNDLTTRTPFSNNLIGLFAKNYFRSSVLEWDADFQRNRFDYYGFPNTDSLAYRQTESLSNILGKKQVFNQASTHLKLSNFNGKGKTDYALALGYSYFWTGTGQHAHQGSLDGQFKVKMRKFNLLSDAQIGYYFQNQIGNVYNQSNNHQFIFAALDPQLAFSGKLWEARAGLNLNLMIDNDTTALFHISPKTYFAFSPIEGILTLFAGTDGQLKTNHYASVLSANPFVHYTSDFKPTNNRLLLYGGIKGKFSRSVSYLLDVNYDITLDELMYYQSFTEYQGQQVLVENTFKVRYQDMNTLSLGGQIRYSGTHLILSAGGHYYTYTSPDASIITNRPAFALNADAGFDVTDKISVRLSTRVTGPRKAEIETSSYSLDQNTGLYGSPVVSWSNPEMKLLLDTHLEINYRFNKQLSFFLSADNILNRNDEKWYGYNNPGLLILGGARFVF